MAALASVFVEVKPTTDRFEPDLRKKLAKVDGSRAGVSIGQSLGSGMRVGVFKSIPGIAKGLVAGFAALKGIQVFSGFIADAQESARVGRLTTQVIKSTGGAARVTADQVGDLATAISNKTGADDEAVQSGENLLLTFTNVRNAVGKGNDIFNQASKAVVDMTAALNNGQVTTDGIKSSSIQLGKALNDPIKGVTALQKVGVSFTASQRDQIKTLVESGHTLDAQKIILKELGKEFGGAAEAAADPMTKLRTILGNVGEDLGTLVLPLLAKFAGFVGSTLVPGLYSAAAIIKGGFTEGLQGNTGFAGVLEHIGDAAHRVMNFITATVIPGFKALIASFKDPDVTSDGFVGQMEQLGVVARHVFDYIRNTAIPTLVDFGKWVVRNQEWLVPLAAGIGAIVAAIKIWTVVTRTFTAVQAALNVVLALNPIGIVVLALVGLAAALVIAYKRSDTFRAIVQTAWRGIQAAASVAWNSFLKPIIAALVAAVTGAWQAFQTMLRVIGAAWEGVKRVTLAAIRFVVGIYLGMVGSILTGAAKAFGWIPGIGPKLKRAADEFAKFRDQVNAALSGVKSRNITVTAKASVLMSQGLSRADAIATTLHRATGGPVFGAGTATSDSIPAMLSNGEHVLTAKEVSAFGGHAAVAQMRKEVVSGFAAGGPVGFNISPRLTGMEQFRKTIAAFNKRADAVAAKLALNAATGPFSPNLAGVVSFARAMAGSPYTWAAAGPKSRGFDCSGFVSNLVEVAKGLPLYRRLFATGSMGSYPWTNHFGGAFKVGWTTNAGGGIGHTGATVNGVNMESRGGDGVVVGSRSRGANYSYFNRHAFLARGGPVLPGDPPFDVLDPRGRHYRPGLLEALQGAHKFDSGGYLPPGVSVAVNGTGRHERVRTGAQEDALGRKLDRIGDLLAALPLAQVDDRYVRRTQRYLAGRDPNGW